MTQYSIKTDPATGVSDISDGDHTFSALYEHRNLLFINLCLLHKEQCSWRHDESTEGWFLLVWNCVAGQISYHIPETLLPLVEFSIPQEVVLYDGHKSSDVVQRLIDRAVHEGMLK